LTRTERTLLYGGGLAGGLAALWLGFALDWDLLNYHLYNPHALVTGRLAIDVVPAQMQTFLNPVLQLPAYLLFMATHSAVPLFVTGVIQGCQAWLLYAILRLLMPKDRAPDWMLPVVAVLGLLGPIFLHQLGGSQGDSLLSLPVLAALLITLQEQRRTGASEALRSGLLSGVLLGTAMAMKLTVAIYVVGLVPAALLMLGGSKRWKWTLGCALGGAIGVALAGGPWFAWLWHAWENPLFPYFNDLFGSSWVGSRQFRDLRYLPQTLSQELLYPWYWTMDPLRVWEFRFRDLRLPLLYSLAALLPWLFLRTRRWTPALALCWLFAALSYLVWLELFAIYRYLAVLEMLAPLLIFATLVSLFRWRHMAVATLALLLLSQALVKYDRSPGNWAFQAQVATALSGLPANAQVLITGFEPVAYAALWLPDGVPMVRIRANFMTGDGVAHRLHRLALDRAAGHRGPSYLLLAPPEREAAFIAPDLARVGLRWFGADACTDVFEDPGLQRDLGLTLCALDPLDSGPVPITAPGGDTGSGGQTGN